MKFIAKYGIGIYLIVSLMYKMVFLIPIQVTEFLYYTVMGAGLLLFVFFGKQLLYIPYKKAFGIFYTIVLLNCAYLLIINFDWEGFLYVLAKFSTANLIAFGIILNLNFYRKIFTKYFKYIITLVLLLGYLYGMAPGELNSTERLEIGFNPNDVGLFAGLGALSVFIFNSKWHKSIVDILFLLFFVLLTLLSGSKAALLNVVLGTVLIYGLRAKIIFAGIAFLIVASVASNFGFTTGIDRLTKTTNAFDTREDTYEKGMQTINDALWMGHGLDKYAWTDPKYWSPFETPLGPHNGYLSVLIMYGVVVGVLYYLLLLEILFKTFSVYRSDSDSFVKFCAVMVLLIFVNALFESLIVGINEFITVLFWFAVGVVGYFRINYIEFDV